MDKATGVTSGKLGPQWDNGSKKEFSEVQFPPITVHTCVREQKRHKSTKLFLIFNFSIQLPTWSGTIFFSLQFGIEYPVYQELW